MSTTIKSASEAERIVRPLVDRWEQEECFLITLNTALRPVDVRLIGIGSESAVIFPSKVICRQAILDLAYGVIIVHTHPSGNVTPSAADIKEIEALRKMLAIFEISLLDHIILGPDSFYSFSEH